MAPSFLPNGALVVQERATRLAGSRFAPAPIVARRAVEPPSAARPAPRVEHVLDDGARDAGRPGVVATFRFSTESRLLSVALVGVP